MGKERWGGRYQFASDASFFEAIAEGDALSKIYGFSELSLRKASGEVPHLDYTYDERADSAGKLAQPILRTEGEAFLCPAQRQRSSPSAFHTEGMDREN